MRRKFFHGSMTLFVLFFQLTAIAQAEFQRVKGEKANYSIEIPDGYVPRSSIGANIDLKYINSEGASIITTVRRLPAGTTDDQISEMNGGSDYQIEEQFAANGLTNTKIIKRGFMTINGRKSHYMHYTNGELYFHSVNQIRSGFLVNLTYTCEYAKKDLYMPYIFRVVNSLKP